MVIEGIRSLLKDERDIEWMGHAMNAASCLAFLSTSAPDIILMDIGLPDMSGVDLCKVVREKYPSVFIVGLSTFNQHSFIQQMMDNGASGYLLKNATQQELMEGIGTVMKGRTYLSMEAAQSLRFGEEEAPPELTRREQEVLELIADGLTNHEIAEKLSIGFTTVETHRRNLISKFGAKNIASLIKSALQKKMLRKDG